jgi:hypothetical protein
LNRLAEEIEQDVETLEEIMERVAVSKAVLKTAGAKVAEKLGRLKPNNNELLAYSPLSRVLELEGLRSGVHGKLGLWDSLAQRAPHDNQLDAQQLAGLVARAERQLDGLREQHGKAAAEAFTPVE